MKHININSLTEYVDATQSGQDRIIKNILKVDTVKAFQYTTLKSVLPKYVQYDFDKQIIMDAIEKLQNREQKSDWQCRDVNNSILALRTFINSEFPKYFAKIKCSFNSKITTKEYYINKMLVRVSPDLIFRWEIDGKKYIGGVKFHIGKTKKLDSNIGIMRATLIYDFLKNEIAQNDEQVDNNYCFCYDVFFNQLFTSPQNIFFYMNRLKKACDEIYQKLHNVA